MPVCLPPTRYASQSLCIINAVLLMLKHTVNLTIYFARHFLLVAVADSFLIEFFSFALILFIFSPVAKIPYIPKKSRTTSRTSILFSSYSVHWDAVECKSIKTEHFSSNKIGKKFENRNMDNNIADAVVKIIQMKGSLE